MTEIVWEIESEGRSWRSDEAMDRYFMTPEILEMVDGKLLGTDQDRETLLCLLLENVGAKRAVQFGDPAVWQAAVAKFGNPNGQSE